jgi:hypothetical protein
MDVLLLGHAYLNSRRLSQIASDRVATRFCPVAVESVCVGLGRTVGHVCWTLAFMLRARED